MSITVLHKLQAVKIIVVLHLLAQLDGSYATWARIAESTRNPKPNRAHIADRR
jgi:hypothetical protein